MVGARRMTLAGAIACEELVTAPAASPPPVKLSVLEAVGAAYDALWERRDDAFRLAAVPAVLFLAIQLFLSWQFAAGPLDGDAALDPANPPAVSSWLMVLSLLGLVPATLFSVNWQRALLLGGHAAPGLGLRWGRRETMFLWSTILIALAALLAAVAVAIPVIAIFVALQLTMNNVVGPAGPGSGLPILPLIAAGLPVMVAEIYVVIRLAPGLAAAALDQSGNLRRSWRMTRGNALRIFLAFLLGVFPFYVAVFVLHILFGATGLLASVPLTGIFLNVIISLVLSAASSALLAIVYRRLGGSSRAQA